MESLVINVNPQLGGYNFGLSPKVRKNLLAFFPDAIQVRHIFVSYDGKWDFEQMQEKVKGQILPFLTGVDLKNLATHFQRVVFVNPAIDSEEYVIPLETNVQKAELVSR